MQYGVTELDELSMLRLSLPELFKAPGRMLYVGANQLRPPHHVGTLRGGGWQLDLVEVFKGNVEHHRESGLFRNIYHGDIRTVELPSKLYDVVMWWHGCEHIPHEDLPQTLTRIEQLAPLVVLGCPHGISPQDTVYGNTNERHLWDVWPADLRAAGYTVRSYECVGRRHLLAWKGTR